MDPTKVVRCGLQNAASVATLLLTTDALVSELPDVHRVVIEGAGHHVHLDQPEAFLEAAVPFLAGVG